MIAGVLKHKVAETFHPILFRLAPMPGGVDIKRGAARHKSAAHHTEGFSNLEEAASWITENNHSFCGTVWLWDGEGVPAMVEWFPNDEVVT